MRTVDGDRRWRAGGATLWWSGVLLVAVLIVGWVSAAAPARAVAAARLQGITYLETASHLPPYTGSARSVVGEPRATTASAAPGRTVLSAPRWSVSYEYDGPRKSLGSVLRGASHGYDRSARVLIVSSVPPPGVFAAEDGIATTPAGRPFSAHYLNETGPQRNIPGSVVDETIDHGTVAKELSDRTVYYDPKNDTTVIVSKTTGKIMSARRGKP